MPPPAEPLLHRPAQGHGVRHTARWLVSSMPVSKLQPDYRREPNCGSRCAVSAEARSAAWSPYIPGHSEPVNHREPQSGACSRESALYGSSKITKPCGPNNARYTGDLRAASRSICGDDHRCITRSDPAEIGQAVSQIFSDRMAPDECSCRSAHNDALTQSHYFRHVSKPASTPVALILTPFCTVPRIDKPRPGPPRIRRGPGTGCQLRSVTPTRSA
jgi:hypothetical protein